MLGRYLRGGRHLNRVASKEPLKYITTFPIDECCYIGELIKVRRTDGNELILVYQDYRDECNPKKSLYEEKYGKYLEDLRNKYSYCFPIMNLNDFIRNGQFGNKTIILPNDFEEQYNKMISNNKKLFANLFSSYCSVDSVYLKLFFALAPESPNMIVWAANNLFKNDASLRKLCYLIDWGQRYKSLISKLSRGTITAYNDNRNIDLLINETINLRRKKRSNDAINSFNTKQKKMLKAKYEEDPNIEHVLCRFNRLSPIKRNNFIRKVSTFETADEILTELSLMVNMHFNWNKEDFIKFITKGDGIHCSIVYDRDQYLLLSVDDYNSIRKVAKNTNWCISKNMKYWYDYVDGHEGDAIQYILCDFSKKEDDHYAMIGFTSMYNRGITNAHNFVNKNIMSESAYGLSNSIIRTSGLKLKSFINCNNGKDNTIMNILHNANIPSSLFIHSDRFKFTIERDVFFHHLNDIMNEEEYNIYYDENNELVLSTSNSTITSLFSCSNENVNIKKYFLFLNFNDGIEESKKLRYSIITEYQNVESSCGVFDLNGFKEADSFDYLLYKYGLPYNIIKRPNSIIEQIVSAINDGEVELVDHILSSKDNVEKIVSISKSGGSDRLFNAIGNSCLNLGTFDILNVFKKNGIKLLDVLTSNEISSLEVLVYQRYEGSYGGISVPDGYITEFLEDILPNSGFKMHVGYYVMLLRLLDEESDIYVIEKFINTIKRSKYTFEIEGILNNILDNHNISNNTRLIKNVTSLASSVHGHSVIKKLDNLVKMTEVTKEVTVPSV